MERRRRLLDAIRANNLSQLQAIVASDDIQLSDPQCHCLLLSAVKQGHVEIADWLLSQACPVNRDADVCNDTALHVAIASKSNDLVNTLLERGALVAARNSHSESPMHVACETANVEALQLLLHKDERVIDVVDQNLHSPLHTAVEKDCSEAVVLLLNRGVNINARTAKVDCEGCAPLHLAILNGNFEVVQALLSHGADVDATVGPGEDSQNGHRFYNMKYDGFAPLHLAVIVNVERIVESLLSFNANVNAFIQQTGVTPLHLAVRSKNKRLVKLFSEHNADLSAKTRDGMSIFHLAVESGWCEFVRELLYKNTAVNDNTNNGDTPLHIAIKAKDQDVIRLLLANNAGVDSKNVKGQTPLHLAIECCTEVAKVLLERGAKVDEVDCDNKTPLAVAIRCRDSETVSLILSYKPNVRNTANKAAFLYAIKNFNFYKKIVNLCISYGFQSVTALNRATRMLSKQQINLIEMLFMYDADVNVRDEFHALPVDHIPYENLCPCSSKKGSDKNKIIEDVVRIFVKHIAFLTYRNKTVDPDNIKKLSVYSNFHSLFASCTDEISKMQNEKIFENVSFYDVLIKKPNELASYGRNEELIQAFKISNYKKKFPLYAERLKEKVVEACRRANLLKRSIMLFNQIVDYDFPQVVIDKIFYFFDENDLTSIYFAHKDVASDSYTSQSKKMKIS